MRHHLGERQGSIREAESGRVLGDHQGTWFHTIGQRRGLGLSGGPWYVVGKDIEQNVIFVVHADSLSNHVRSSFAIANPHWVAEPPTRSRLQVRIRHGERIEACTISQRSRGSLAVEFDTTEDSGVAPGQFAALYDGEECLGGGVVE